MDIKGTLWALAAVLLLFIWMMHGCQSRFERRREMWHERQQHWQQRREERREDRGDWHWGDRWRNRRSEREWFHDKAAGGSNPAAGDVAGDHGDHVYLPTDVLNQPAFARP